MRLAYAGIFYEGVRPIERLGALVELLAEELGETGFEVDLFGDNERWRGRLAACSASSTKRVHFHGSVPRSALLPRLSEYDALLNFGNSTSFQVPSKVIEYAALGVEIINVKGRRDDTSEQLLEEYPFATSLLIPDDGSNDWLHDTKQRLHSFLSKQGPSESANDERAQWLGRFSTSRVGDIYLDVIRPR
jgi:hypothetical protein